MRRLAEVLEEAMSRAGLAGELEVTRLRSVWEEVVGPDSAWALPWAVQDGVLTLAVPSAAHRGEAQLRAGHWTAKLHEKMPGAGVRRIRVMVRIPGSGEAR